MTTMRRLLACSLALVLVLGCGSARADTEITLFKSVAGKVNFIGTQKTLRTTANGNGAASCALVSAPSMALAGLPSDATVLSAQLYWAGSGATGDFTVKFDGTVVTALAGRQWANSTGSTLRYFGGAADVTAIVAAKGNGAYPFEDLTVDNGNPYCSSQAVLAGAALVVIYSQIAEPFRVVNLYEGFRYVQDNRIEFSLGNFKIPNPVGTSGRIAHITWEGDAAVGSDGEELRFNGDNMYDSINPEKNPFNSKSNINNDSASYGIDFDVYTVPIQAGETSAATRYETGSDRVVFNAEIIAVPNVATADLGIVLERSGALLIGQNASYTITVTNNGPSTETGPVTVIDALPTGMTYVAATGTGWVCSTGSTVTCNHAGSLNANASLPVLTVTALVDTAGTYTNTVHVDGVTFDNISANDDAHDTATATVAATSYVFTDSVCLHGKKFSEQSCKLVSWDSILAGSTKSDIYLTWLVGEITTRLSSTASTTVSAQFALSCIDPTTPQGIKATVAGTVAGAATSVELKVCSSNGALPTVWSSVLSLTFPTNSPSASANLAFQYKDVGKVQLYMIDSLSKVGNGAPFVSIPAKLLITTPNATTSSAAGVVFAKAGAPFSLTIGSYTVDNAPTPNFGRETLPASLMVTAEKGLAEMVDVPPLVLDVITGSFSWDEVGILHVTPEVVWNSTNNYLGAETASVFTVDTPATIGRFIPDHFDTAIIAPMPCAVRMACPAGVLGAAYSAQPFVVQVTARRASGNPAKNYRNSLAKDVTLSAFSSPGGAVANPPATAAGALSGATVVAADFTEGVSKVPVTPLTAYNFPAAKAYVHTAPQRLDWIPPTTIYLRAIDTDAASSLRTNAVEGGIRIVSGRLDLANVAGSERMPLPIKMTAQFWGGTHWENSVTDGVSTVDPTQIAYSNCLAGLASCGAAPVSTLLQLDPASTRALAAGSVTYHIRAPGIGRNGSATVNTNGPSWLPSTKGSIKFGVNRSPLIYLREVH